MKQLSKKRTTAIIISLICILLTLAFIFGNSVKSKEESGKQSHNVVEIIKPIVDADDSIPMDIFEFNVRKIAHFLEFALLSFQLTLLYLLLKGNFPVFYEISFAFLITVICAMIDETIQLFSDRGSSVVDVFIDGAGGLGGILTITLLFYVIKYLRNKIPKNRSQTVDKS